MVKNEIIAIALLACVASSCTHRMTWTGYPMDGHRTGVTAPNASNVTEALGTIENGVYTAPNGKVFTDGSIVSVAQDMIDAQPRMSALKEVIGYATREMDRHGADSELSNWIVDHLSEDVAKLTGKKIDVGIINSGGIRVDMPQGDIILDDIVSMFPFKNYLAYVALQGTDLQALFEHLAATHIQPLYGVKIKATEGKIDTLLVGGQPIDPDKIYGVATIDFLLDGGDGISVAKNCKELIITDCMVVESMLPYVRQLTAEGKPVEYFTDGRIVEIRKERRPVE